MLGVQLAGAHPMAVTASPAVHMYVRRDEEAAAAASAANCVPAERPLNLGQAPSAAERRYAGARLPIRPHVADETGRGREFAGKMPALLDDGFSSRRNGRRLCRIRLGDLAKGVSHIK